MSAPTMMPHRLIMAITGASGAAIGCRIAEKLANAPQVELHFVLSAAGKRTLLAEEGARCLHHIRALPAIVHDERNIGATIASGSFRTAGMIIAPCSMRTLAAIASGVADNLITRAADVQLKERRRLVLLTRETPLHLGHLRNMCAVTEMGAIIMPPVPAFYHKPCTIDEIVEDLACRAIALFDLPVNIAPRVWDGKTA